MSNGCHFKLVEAKTRYWHWVFYSNGKPIAASAKAGKSQKNVADTIRLIMEGAADAAIQIAPMKLDEHVEANEAADAKNRDAESPEIVPDMATLPDDTPPQSIPATEAVEG